MPPEYKPEFTNDDPWTNAYQVLDAMVEGGWGYKGDTLEELAKNAGMDAATFVEAYDTYNSMCKAGEDTLFMKDSKYMIDMGEEGPFYVVAAEINSLGTLGGLVINDKFMVLDGENTPIGGLFAVGRGVRGCALQRHVCGLRRGHELGIYLRYAGRPRSSRLCRGQVIQFRQTEKR